jgi:hypothetical protein
MVYQKTDAEKGDMPVGRTLARPRNQPPAAMVATTGKGMNGPEKNS